MGNGVDDVGFTVRKKRLAETRLGKCDPLVRIQGVFSGCGMLCQVCRDRRPKSDGVANFNATRACGGIS